LVPIRRSVHSDHLHILQMATTYSTSYQEEAKKNLKKAASQLVTCAEEYEREVRLLPEKMEDFLKDKEKALSTAYTTLMEEYERIRRLEEKVSKKFEEEGVEHDVDTNTITKLEEEERRRRIQEDTDLNTAEEEHRKDDKAYVIIKEEEERLRRVAEDAFMEEEEEEHRKDNRAYATIKEEEEKQRRIAEEEYIEETEEEYRKDNRAYATIKEEEEKQRRISEDQYIEEVFNEYEQTNRAHSLVAEEQERQRRISMPPSKEQLEKIKNLAKSVADKVRERRSEMFKKKHPVRRSSESAWVTKKQEGEKPMKIPVKTKNVETNESKPLKPNKKRYHQKKEAKKEEKVLEERPVGAIPTSIEMAGTQPTIVVAPPPETDPMKERKELVDKMSKEIFEKIANKVLKSERR